ncbi:glycosyltransferase family 4 protein [Arthrobacter echini]|uniref:Glycosyltransferase family 4 protein n=1 Tax=Arthrobacter echini TaxID=1529066 RepID=A0A4S5E3E5_9MICC|nr:glycosyltransferase family 4 protein [Arthrobacter echini]THJ65955.1 glycosyltransferase family 4 protein [Arthrobacter echini]
MTDKDVPELRPRVLVLSFSPIIRDPRVLRQIKLLSEFADVISCGYGESPTGVVEHVQIPDDFKPWRKDFKSTAVLLAARFYEKLYFDSERILFVRGAIPVRSVDVVIANDVIAVPLALALRPAMGVHADLHEYAPRQGEDRLQWKLLVGPFMHWAARKYVTRVNSTTTVAKGIAEEYARVYGIPEPQVVPNASSYEDRYSPTEVQTPLRLIHTGAAGRGRKIEIMIDAVARANELRPGTATLDLVMVPGEQKYIDELTARSAAVPDGAVRMKPPVQFDQIVPMLQNYDVGIFICPPSTFNLLHALPNKLFEFVQARLAIVIGPSPEMERVVRQYDVGVVADDFDAESVARVLLDLTPESVAEMKQASHRAARPLSAEEVTGPWEDAVRKLTGILP